MKPKKSGEEKMVIQELKRATKRDLVDINRLLKQLVSSFYLQLTLPALYEITHDKKTIVLVIRNEGHILGMGTILLATKLRGKAAYIEDMIVDAMFRRKGLGLRLTKKCIKIAKLRRVRYIELSTRPERVAANNLYRKLGFIKKETNVYRLTL